MGDLAGIIGILCVFGIPLSAIWTHHRRKVLEMQLQLRGQGDTGRSAEFDALRQEVRSLRDTSTQYDLSFDAALQRMEQRVERMERQAQIPAPDDQVQIGMRR
jgi:hypothetical protein